MDFIKKLFIAKTFVYKQIYIHEAQSL